MSPKAALKRELLLALRQTLQVLTRAHLDAREGATHEEARPEDDKDTRALEQSYLARGQAARIDALKAGIAELELLPVAALKGAPAGLGALVEAEEDDGPHTFFLAPEGGGTRLRNGAVQVVTPRSPLGQALVGRRAGEVCEVQLAGKTRELSIVRVS